MNMENLVETVLQYGIAGAALLMMYTIAYHHLTRVEDLLLEILEVLKEK